MTEHPSHLVLFDGVCNLCNGAVRFIIRHDRKGKFKFASLQSTVGRKILEQIGGRPGGDLYSIVLIRDGKAFDRSTAALEIARDLSPPWHLLYSFRVVPKFLRDAVYKLVAVNRYRIFGKKDACMIPTPELRARFVE